MLLTQAARRREDCGSTCLTATDVCGDFGRAIISLDHRKPFAQLDFNGPQLPDDLSRRRPCACHIAPPFADRTLHSKSGLMYRGMARWSSHNGNGSARHCGINVLPFKKSRNLPRHEGVEV